MINTLKKHIAFLLILVLLLSTQSVQVMANKLDANDIVSTEPTYLSEIYINPLYADVIDASDLKKSSDKNVVATTVSEYCTSFVEAGAIVREQMKNRSETIEVGLQTDVIQDNMAKSIVTEAVAHTGDPKEGDSLLWQYAGWNCNSSRYSENGFYYITFTYTMTYYTTESQEKELDTAVDNVLNQLNLNDKTDYEKTKNIYDYICANVTYDHEHENDKDYKLKYTAYAALINKTAVCQGFAVLLYRLSLEAGIDARLIAGTSNNDIPHGWNIVQLKNKYYNLDSTWDAGKSEYDYFLRCDDNFPNHVRSEDYTTDEFISNYPMGEQDYQPSEDDDPVSQNPFVDVEESDYYYDAVLWAYENGITNGSDETHFNPSGSCTRAEAITFIWRANGKPISNITVNPFTDVKENTYYYNAILWAYENRIANGTDSSHFQPSRTVTRKEFLTFLWRSIGEPEPTITNNPFEDVPNDAYYTSAVLWAYENGITSGSDEIHFKPNNNCTRAQAVTFLYRLQLIN